MPSSVISSADPPAVAADTISIVSCLSPWSVVTSSSGLNFCKSACVSTSGVLTSPFSIAISLSVAFVSDVSGVFCSVNWSTSDWLDEIWDSSRSFADWPVWSFVDIVNATDKSLSVSISLPKSTTSWWTSSNVSLLTVGSFSETTISLMVTATSVSFVISGMSDVCSVACAGSLIELMLDSMDLSWMKMSSLRASGVNSVLPMSRSSPVSSWSLTTSIGVLSDPAFSWSSSIRHFLETSAAAIASVTFTVSSSLLSSMVPSWSARLMVAVSILTSSLNCNFDSCFDWSAVRSSGSPSWYLWGSKAAVGISTLSVPMSMASCSASYSAWRSLDFLFISSAFLLGLSSMMFCSAWNSFGLLDDEGSVVISSILAIGSSSPSSSKPESVVTFWTTFDCWISMSDVGSNSSVSLSSDSSEGFNLSDCSYLSIAILSGFVTASSGFSIWKSKSVSGLCTFFACWIPASGSWTRFVRRISSITSINADRMASCASLCAKS